MKVTLHWIFILLIVHHVCLMLIWGAGTLDALYKLQHIQIQHTVLQQITRLQVSMRHNGSYRVKAYYEAIP